MNISNSQRAVIIAVFATFIIAQLGYAVYSRKNMKSSTLDKYVKDFYTGGRGMGGIVVALMVAAGVAGAGVFMGMPGRAYATGQPYMFSCFWSLTMNFMVLGVLGKKTGIIARRAGISSYVGVMADRYENDKLFRVVSSIMFLLFLGMFAANTYSGGAKLFEAMTGQSYTTGLIIFTILILVSTLLGGVKGVAGAIVLQGAIMTLAIVVFFIGALINVGGFSPVYHTLAETCPEWFEMNSNGYMTTWQGVINMAITLGLLTFTMPQAAMGALVHKNTKSLHAAIKIGVCVVFIWSMGLNLLIPVIKYVFPDLTEHVSADLGIPYLVMSSMPAWVAGLCLAGVCAAVQSSLNGMAVSLSAVIVKDLWETLKPDSSPKTMKTVSTVATILVCVCLFWFAKDPPPLMSVVGVYASGGLAAAFTAPYLVGMYWPRANKYGAMASMIVGVIVYVTVENKMFLPNFAFGGIAAGVIGAVLTMVVVSLLTPKTNYETILRWFGRDYFGSENSVD